MREYEECMDMHCGNVLNSANPVNDEDTQARTTPDPAPILIAAKLDRTAAATPGTRNHAP
jgi:hypothetical protein